MTINSLIFIVFVAIVAIIYFIFPKKAKWVVLLIANYAFYCICSNKLIIYMLITTLSIYLVALKMGKIDIKTKEMIKKEEKEKKKQIKNRAKTKKKWLVAIAIIINFGILIYLKYSNFLSENINAIFDLIKIPMEIPSRKILLPLGISYYTLQAISYVIDVYRGKYLPERHLGKLALFVSFFPQMVEGPIGRYDQLGHQLYDSHKFEYTRFKFGIQLMLWGYFKKLVIADRARIVCKRSICKLWTIFRNTNIFCCNTIYYTNICRIFGMY